MQVYEDTMDASYFSNNKGVTILESRFYPASSCAVPLTLALSLPCAIRLITSGEQERVIKFKFGGHRLSCRPVPASPSVLQ